MGFPSNLLVIMINILVEVVNLNLGINDKCRLNMSKINTTVILITNFSLKDTWIMEYEFIAFVESQSSIKGLATFPPTTKLTVAMM